MLNPLEDKMLPMVAVNREQAVTFYQACYLPAHLQKGAKVATLSAAAAKHRDRIVAAAATEHR